MISAIVPAFNEATRIGPTICGVMTHVDEVVVVDDGSRDDTARVAAAAGALVVRQENAGYISAIKHGFRVARGDVLVTIDADGEFPAEAIPDLLAPILSGQADYVQGRRDVIPRTSERVLNWLANTKGPLGDTGTGLRAMRGELARRLEIRGMCICGVLALEAYALGARVAEVPITLRSVPKPRRIAWFHLRQLFHLLPWLVRRRGVR